MVDVVHEARPRAEVRKSDPKMAWERSNTEGKERFSDHSTRT